MYGFVAPRLSFRKLPCTLFQLLFFFLQTYPLFLSSLLPDAQAWFFTLSLRIPRQVKFSISSTSFVPPSTLPSTLLRMFSTLAFLIPRQAPFFILSPPPPLSEERTGHFFFGSNSLENPTKQAFSPYPSPPLPHTSHFHLIHSTHLNRSISLYTSSHVA